MSPRSEYSSGLAPKRWYAARMRPNLILAGFVLAAFLNGCKSNPGAAPNSNAASQPAAQTTGAGSGFDFYLLNLSWSPEFCHSHPDAQECAAHATFVLHGLWPQNNDGSYPQHCSDAPGPANPATYSDIYPEAGLLEHEWSTHGACSGLSPDAFFSTARNAFRSVKIPAELSRLSSQTSMPPGEILGLFTDANPALTRASLALSCGNNYLTAVEVCLDKGLHPVACPNVRSCRANVVKIPPP